MSTRRFACLLTCVLFVFAGSASAETISYQFVGTVTYGGPMAVPVGAAVVGSYSYNTNASPAITYKGYADYQIPTPSTISLSVAGHTVTTGGLSVAIWNHSKGNVEDMIQVSGGAVVLDGTTFGDGTLGFQLASAPRNNRALNGTKLPSTIDVSLFNAGPTLNYGFLQTDGGPQGMLLQFTVDSVVVTARTP